MSKKEEGPKLEFEFHVTLKKVRHRRRDTQVLAPNAPHPIVRTLALAHRIEAMIREGKARNYADAAGSLGVTRARVGQVTGLLLLSPAVQEAILAAAPERLASLSERKLCALAATPDWAEQTAIWSTL